MPSPSPSSGWHLAQVNVARALAPLDSPVMAGFVARIAEINALAEASPGYVWRFQDDTGNALYVRPYEDAHILFNLSVWQTPDHLRAYVYRSNHVEVMRQKQQWFEPSDEAILALWWIPAGTLPTVEEAKARLAHLRQHGASAHAFGFREIFSPPA